MTDYTLYKSSKEGRDYSTVGIKEEPINPIIEQGEAAINRFSLSDTTNSVAGSVNKALMNLVELPFLFGDLALATVGSDHRMKRVSDISFIKPFFESKKLPPEVEDYVRPVRVGLSFAAEGVAPGSFLVGTGKKSLNFLKEEAIDAGLFGGGAAVGSVIAGEDNIGLELLGGLVGASRGFTVRHAVNAVKMGWEVGRQRLSKTAQATNAVDVILSHATNPEQAIKNIRANVAKGREGTLGTLSGDDGILAVEKTLSRKSSNTILSRGINDKDTAVTNKILNALDEIAEDIPGVTSDYFKTRLAYHDARTKELLNKAVDKARFAREAIDTPLYPGDASGILHKEIDSIVQQSKADITRAWENVPKEMVNSEVLISKAVNALNSSLKTETAKNAAVTHLEPIRKILETLRKQPVMDIKELTDLRSVIMDTQRNINKEGKSRFANKALNDLNSFIVKTLEEHPSTNNAYRYAASLTRQFHETFSDGVLSAARDHNVIPEMLGSKLFVSGPKGGANADAITQNLGLGNTAHDAVNDYVKSYFMAATTGKGGIEIDPVAGTNFLRKHAEFLKRYPQLQKELRDAVKTQKQVTTLGKRFEQLNRNSVVKAKMETFIGYENPKEAVDAITRLAVKDRAGSMRYLVNMAKTDPTGLALEGLKGSTIQSLLGKITKDVNVDDKIILANYNKYFKEMEPALKEAFTPREIKHIENIIKQADGMIRRKGVPTLDINPEADFLVATIGRILGARIGARVGVTPLISAGIGATLVKRVASTLPYEKSVQLMEEMILHPDLFIEASKGIRHIKTPEDAIQLVNGWLLASTELSSRTLLEDEKVTPKNTLQRVDKAAGKVY